MYVCTYDIWGVSTLLFHEELQLAHSEEESPHEEQHVSVVHRIPYGSGGSGSIKVMNAYEFDSTVHSQIWCEYNGTILRDLLNLTLVLKAVGTAETSTENFLSFYPLPYRPDRIYT